MSGTRFIILFSDMRTKSASLFNPERWRRERGSWLVSRTECISFVLLWLKRKKWPSRKEKRLWKPTKTLYCSLDFILLSPFSNRYVAHIQSFARCYSVLFVGEEITDKTFYFSYVDYTSRTFESSPIPYTDHNIS